MWDRLEYREAHRARRLCRARAVCLRTQFPLLGMGFRSLLHLQAVGEAACRQGVFPVPRSCRAHLRTQCHSLEVRKCLAAPTFWMTFQTTWRTGSTAPPTPSRWHSRRPGRRFPPTSPRIRSSSFTALACSTRTARRINRADRKNWHVWARRALGACIRRSSNAGQSIVPRSRLQLKFRRSGRACRRVLLQALQARRQALQARLQDLQAAHRQPQALHHYRQYVHLCHHHRRWYAHFRGNR